MDMPTHGRYKIHKYATLLLIILSLFHTGFAQLQSGTYYHIRYKHTKNNGENYMWPSSSTVGGNPLLGNHTKIYALDYTDINYTTPTNFDYTWSAWKVIQSTQNGYTVYQLYNSKLQSYMTWTQIANGNRTVVLQASPTDINKTYFAIDGSGTDLYIKPFNITTGQKGNQFNYTWGPNGSLAASGNGSNQDNNGNGNVVGFDNGNSCEFIEAAAVGIMEFNTGWINISSVHSADGATIYYTTDNSDPVTSATTTTYTSQFMPDHDDRVVKAYARNGSYVSEVVTIELRRMQSPTITLSGNTATLSTTEVGATIYYTTDGTKPTLDGNGNPVGTTQAYTGAIDISSISLIRAVTARRGRGDMSREAIYVVSPVTVARSSEITSMAASYILSENFIVDTPTPIGTEDDPFIGTIDGKLRTIQGLGHPLLGVIKDATVCNVIIDNANISVTGNSGAIACTATGSSRIFNCGVLATQGSTIAGTGYTGSIVGQIDDSTKVINCFSYANITGGSVVAGIIGYNSFASTQSNLKTIVMNCMFYGDITGGTTRYPVYGGMKIVNNVSTNSINNYNYYREEASLGTLADYNCSWPAGEIMLTRWEQYRSILNSNRTLAAFYLDPAPVTVSGTGANAVRKYDTSLVAKWVIDPEMGRYPVLKRWGTYPSVINADPSRVWNDATHSYTDRSTITQPYKGRRLGSLQVTVNAGSRHSASTTVTLIVTDMDTAHHDYCYRKVQLPYYNELFADANATTFTDRYAHNYTDYVVTGWKITSVTGGTPGTFVGQASRTAEHYLQSDNAWEDGYNFTDRQCTAKDMYAVSGRVFAQGGYYYVPDGVTAITIEAYWGRAVYLTNADRSIDRLNNNEHFAPAGALPQSTPDGTGTVISHIKDAQKWFFDNNRREDNGMTVYDNAIVLVGNYQFVNSWDNNLFYTDDNTGKVPFTLMSIDLDLDNEPDYCFELQAGNNSGRYHINPLRYDFLPVIGRGTAMKGDGTNNIEGIGVFMPSGHFEITETAFLDVNQLEYDENKGSGEHANTQGKTEAPLIINNGYIEEMVSSNAEGSNLIMNHTQYIFFGGHFKILRCAQGIHNDRSHATRHCAFNICGADIETLYLSGYFRPNANVHADNPHCYIDGGRFTTIAGAGKEKIDGNVTFKIRHSIIDELYGGGINADNPVTGNISLTIDSSYVGKFCGGPMFGDMNSGKTITTSATGTTFKVYYGGGNGGTNYIQYERYDNLGGAAWATEADWHVADYTPLSYDDRRTAYKAKYEFQILRLPSGNAFGDTRRTYLYVAKFAATNVGDITNTLNGCTIETNFYGGGNLGGVNGDVTSTLNNCQIYGSAYGAGFSATIEPFDVYTKTGLVFPTQDINTNVISYGNLGQTVQYNWTNETSLGGQTLSTTSPSVTVDGKNYLYTTIPLSNLGTVTGNVSITIKGNSQIGTFPASLSLTESGNVFGGGNESKVDGNTNVIIQDDTTIGNNVYGGGNKGIVRGNTNVNIGR